MASIQSTLNGKLLCCMTCVMICEDAQGRLPAESGTPGMEDDDLSASPKTQDPGHRDTTV